MYMKLKDGKSKVLTLSYDDGVVQDIRLVDIFNKFGLKATFNINTGLYFPEDKMRESFYGRMKLSEAKALYANSGHEVAVHMLTHPFPNQIKKPDLYMEVLEDRKNIEKEFGTLARGMAYPYGCYDDDVVASLRECGICYSRTTASTENFGFPTNWLTLHPTCHHNNPRLMELAEKFVETSPRYMSENWMFYVWGHSYEFDNLDNWRLIEDFCECVGQKDDVWYATNIEIYDYVKAWEALQTSVDENIVYNPSQTDVWFAKGAQVYCVRAGEILKFN